MNKQVVAVVFILAFAAICQAQDDADTRRAFINYMRKYNKQYSGPNEVERRYGNFKAALARTDKMNKSSKGAVFGITKFSDLSPEEFQATVLLKNPIVVNKTEPYDSSRVLPKRDIGALPTSFDWRQRGAVTPVKDQGQCGSCWAFSVTENIESMWILAGKANVSDLSLSPQQLVDCDWTSLGCNGGDTPLAFEYVMHAGGLESISDYPYTAEDDSCSFDASDITASISTWQFATSWFNETEMQQNLVAWGPLSICVDASAWQDYVSGVLTASECAYINQLDHCVQLVGYDAKASTPYYMVRNSWNTDWGVEGYIYLEMGANTCGLVDLPTCAVI